MTVYDPPLDDMRFALIYAAGFQTVCGLSDNEALTPDLADLVLEEAARPVRGGWASLHEYGDYPLPRMENGRVLMPDVFKKAYSEYVQSGLNGMDFPIRYGGQDLPNILAVAVSEMVHASSAVFGLCPMLTRAVAAAVAAHGSETLKKMFLPHLISGRWTGTMNMTEETAGSDLSAVRAKAVAAEDGTYRISGRKQFITFGDHDMSENIVGAVLARTEGAPDGVKGLSLFLVPKFLFSDDGKIGAANTVKCLSLENKPGIKVSPTCVMEYSEATGYRIGDEHKGLEYAFTMMNHARLSVGAQSVGTMTRAYQSACRYAGLRVQGKDIGGKSPEKVPIIRHPDIRRILLTVLCAGEAARCLVYYTAALTDISHSTEEKIAGKALSRSGLLIPAVKAWCSDLAAEMTALAARVYGGAGYVSETGADRLWRDAAVFPIYEGTNGIQAAEFVFRRISSDKGATVRSLIREMTLFCEEYIDDTSPSFVSFITRFHEGIACLNEATDYILEKAANNPVVAACAASPYLRMSAIITAGYIYAKAVFRMRSDADLTDAQDDRPMDKLRFFGEVFIPQAVALLPTVKLSHGSIMNICFTEEKKP